MRTKPSNVGPADDVVADRIAGSEMFFKVLWA